MALGWLTTQAVVETARQQGAKELVALRVCPGTLLIPA
jgi:hypothetical protein